MLSFCIRWVFVLFHFASVWMNNLYGFMFHLENLYNQILLVVSHICSAFVEVPLWHAVTAKYVVDILLKPPKYTTKPFCLPLLYCSCVWSSMLHGSETWPVRKENEVALQRAEMRMVRWMCGLNIEFQVMDWERLGLDDIISVLQKNRLRWYGHVLRKEDNNRVKKCMEYEVEGARPRGIPKKTWREIV